MRRLRPFVLCVLALMLSVSAHAQGKAPAPQVVDIKATGGVTLKATYYPSGRPGPGIVMLHACNKDRSSWTQVATDAAANGFHVLALDFRGFGESGGKRFTQGPEQQSTIDLYWPGDVEAALAWLTSQAQVDKARIGAAGASCGVNQAVQLARNHPEVRTLVLLSGGVNAPARLYLRDSPWLPVFGGRERRRRWRGWSDAVGACLVEKSRQQVRRVQSGRARHRHVLGREGAPTALHRVVQPALAQRAAEAAGRRHVAAVADRAVLEHAVSTGRRGRRQSAADLRRGQTREEDRRPLSRERDQPARLPVPPGWQREGCRGSLQAERRRVPVVGQHLRQPVGWLSRARQPRGGASLRREDARDDSQGHGGDRRFEEAPARGCGERRSRNCGSSDGNSVRKQ